MSDTRRLWRYAAQRRWLLAGIVVAALAGFPLQVVGIEASRRLVNAATAPQGATLHALLCAGAALLTAAVFANLAQALETDAQNRLSRAVCTDIRMDAFRHVLGLPVSYFDTHNPREIIARVEDDVSSIGTSVYQVWLYLASSAVRIAVGLVGMFATDRRLALLSLAFLPATSIAGRLLAPQGRRTAASYREYWSEYQTRLSDIIHGIREVIIYGQQAREARRHRGRNEILMARLLRNQRALLGFSTVLVTLNEVMSRAVMVYGGYLAYTHHLAWGDVVAFMGYSGMITGPFSVVAAKWGAAQVGLASASRVFEVLDVPGMAADPGPRAPHCACRVAMQGTSFAYGPGEEVLRGVSLELRPGKVAALVGLSGAGKTTIASLLLRLYETNDASIALNGVPYAELDSGFVRSHFGYVPQEPYLFDGSVLENVSFGRDQEPDEGAVRAALGRAGALSFVESLPGGLHAAVGPRGATLSGGQAQRIGLARALFAGRPVLILDEATSALDSEAESLVRLTCRELSRDHAVLVIGHRLSSIITADEICVLRDGAVVERGTHEDLMASNGEYTKLFLSQARPEDLLREWRSRWSAGGGH